MLSKIVPVLGDVSESSLGLDEDVADLMVKEVDIIVNSAANTTFDERLEMSFQPYVCVLSEPGNNIIVIL